MTMIARVIAAYNRFRDSGVGAFLAVVMVGAAVLAVGYSTYPVTPDPVPATTVDLGAECLLWVQANGRDDSLCDPFTADGWATLTGGLPPVGNDGEGLDGWTYNSSPEGTFIIGPNRLRIWVPADPGLCPQIIAGGMSEGRCPAWVSNG